MLSLMTNGPQAAGPAAAMAAISSTSSADSPGNPNELDLDEAPANSYEESDTEQVTKSFGVLKVDNKSSFYFSDAHWASVLNDIAEVRNYFATHKRQYEEQAERLKAAKTKNSLPGSSLLFGVTKPMSRDEIMTSFPSRYITDILISRYFNSYDPSTYVLHGPTFQAQYDRYWEDPDQACISWIGMLFAMMRLAMLSYHREGDEPPEFRDKSLHMAAGFRNLLAQCLALADYTRSPPFLIEALIFHLHGDFCQARDADISIWVLVGVTARLAMRMGYHRDSKFFPNITPFQGEMRRRVWTFVRQAEILFSFQVGLPSMLRTADSDTELPRNLYDDDLDEDCHELPPSRPPNEPTPISYLIAKARLTFAFGRVIEYTSAVKSGSYETVMEIDADLHRALDLIPEHLHIRPMEECQLETASLILSRFAVNSVYHKAQCVLHRRYLIPARENPRFAYSRQTCLDSAMELLSYQSILHTETCSTGRLRSGQSRISSLGSTDFILAATIVCLDLYHSFQLQAVGRSTGDMYVWGRSRRDEMMAAVKRSKAIWDELRDESMEAWKASGMLEVMLGKMNIGMSSAENSTGAPGFAAHDEKQSAAMTLGLLSSGLSPLPSAPLPLSTDTNFVKINGSPTSSQPLLDLPAASAPFNVFAQMPDMQLNLDWDAWDNYIQNANFEGQNQWWPMFDPQQTQLASSTLYSARSPPATNVGVGGGASARSNRSVPGVGTSYSTQTGVAYDQNGVSGL